MTERKCYCDSKTYVDGVCPIHGKSDERKCPHCKFGINKDGYCRCGFICPEQPSARIEPVRARDGGIITKRKALDIGGEILDYIKKQDSNPARIGPGTPSIVTYWIRRYQSCLDQEKFIPPSILRAQGESL